MNPKSRPKFDRERFMFFRRENAGYASAISPEDPSKALHVLNPTVVDIADLCTGQATLEEIRAQYAARYQQNASGPLARYVDEAVFMLSLYNLVSFDVEEAPPMTGPPMPKVRRLEEWDFHALREMFGGGDFPEKNDPPIFHFRNPYVSMDLYSELALRLRIFQQREFFYAITTGGKVDFAVSFFDERPQKPMACIALIVGKPAYGMDEGLSCILPVLIKEVSPFFHKLEWRYVVGETDYSQLISILDRFGFKKEAVLNDEFGPGIDEIVYGNILAKSGEKRQSQGE